MNVESHTAGNLIFHCFANALGATLFHGCSLTQSLHVTPRQKIDQGKDSEFIALLSSEIPNKQICHDKYCARTAATIT